MKKRTVRCRFCTFAVPVFWRNNAGRARSGFARLAEHVSDEHPREYLASIEEVPDEELDDLGLALREYDRDLQRINAETNTPEEKARQANCKRIDDKRKVKRLYDHRH